MGDDPEAQMRHLIKEREPFYARADAKVETDKKTPDQIAAEVVRLAQTGAGW
jgi:shikimate kinase